MYHPLPPNPLPPSTSTYPNPPNSSQSHLSQLVSMTRAVPFAGFSDPFKLFDGLDHTYAPEKLLAHVSACVTFQLRPHPPGNQSYLTWHSKFRSRL